MSSGETDEAANQRPKKLSPSITELELAFAQDPTSSAFVPLCQAYLEQSHFINAMVVAKKALKAHPGSIEARLVLASVYARQQKFPRALEEANEVVTQNPSSAAAYLGRARIRLESGDEQGGVADLRVALDFDPSTHEATELLRRRGMMHPEAPPPPVALPPPPPPPVALPSLPPTPALFSAADVSRPASGVYSSTIPRSGSLVPPPSSEPAPSPRRPRLEGEDELEALANVASPPSQAGKARLTFSLAAALLVVAVGGGAWMFHNKRVTEGVADLTRQGRAAFLEDTYGSYQRAAEFYKTILTTLDADHPATLGALAHTYAILWGEHGDVDKKAELDRVLKAAELRAQDNPHTIAARGLIELYDSPNRQKSAATAYAAIWPGVKALRERNQNVIGTFADLTLGIIDTEAGNYTSAASALQDVVNAMPGSVRAKVAYARAAQRAGDLGKAEIAFSEALNIAKDHSGARAGRALVRVQRGRLEAAGQDLVSFDEFAQKAPKQVSNKDSALADYARSEIVRAAGDDGAARAYYDRAVNRDPGNPEFSYGLGRSYLANGRAKDAIAPLTAALAKEPTRRAFMVALAEAQTVVEDYSGAEKNVNAALAQEPRDLNASLIRGRLLVAQRKPEAETYLKEVLGWSKAPQANLELGKLYAASGKSQDAKAALEAASEGAQNQTPMRKAEIALEYGKLMNALDDPSTALSSFKQAAEWGAIEGWFRTIEIVARGSKKEREALKGACERYLSAGSALPHAAEARALCAGAAK